MQKLCSNLISLQLILDISSKQVLRMCHVEINYLEYLSCDIKKDIYNTLHQLVVKYREFKMLVDIK